MPRWMTVEYVLPLDRKTITKLTSVLLLVIKKGVIYSKHYRHGYRIFACSNDIDRAIT